MDNKEYLNEEKYQKGKKKINGVGTVLLIIGVIMLLFGFVMAFGFHKLGFFFFAVIGMALVGFGVQAKLLGHGREISAYMVQSQMPVAKEGIEEMAPTIGKAGASIAKEMTPVYGEVAKEIAKGVKEGLKDEDK